MNPTYSQQHLFLFLRALAQARFGGGDPAGRVRRVADRGVLLEPVGPVDLSDNLAGARWSKLAINSAISTLGTLGRDSLGSLMKYRFVRRLAHEGTPVPEIDSRPRAADWWARVRARPSFAVAVMEPFA